MFISPESLDIRRLEQGQSDAGEERIVTECPVERSEECSHDVGICIPEGGGR